MGQKLFPMDYRPPRVEKESQGGMAYVSLLVSLKSWFHISAPQRLQHVIQLCELVQVGGV